MSGKWLGLVALCGVALLLGIGSTRGSAGSPTRVRNGALGRHPVAYYAITGGVGAYADARGQIKVVSNLDGTSSSTVMIHR